MSSENFKLNYRCCCVWLFLLIYINESLVFSDLYSATFQAILTFGCFVGVCLYSALFCNNTFIGKKFSIRKSIFVFYVILIGCICGSVVANGLNITFDVYGIYIMTIALVTVSIMERESFYYAYVDVMTFLAVASIIIFCGYHLLPKSLFSIFPNYYLNSGILMKNCYLTVLTVSAQYYRNFGIFAEPGMYAVFLIWALFIALYKIEIDIKKIIILFVALGTSLSTGGYIGGILLIIIFVLTKYNISARNKKKIATIMLILLVGVIAFMYNNPSNFHFLTDKIFNSSDDGSGFERRKSVEHALEAFMENPFLGIGMTGWLRKYSDTINTTTPINWFGQRGLLYGMLMNVFYLKNAVIKNKSDQIQWRVSISLMVVLLWNVSSQNLANDFILFMLVFHQMVDDNKYILNYHDSNFKGETVN